MEFLAGVYGSPCYCRYETMVEVQRSVNVIGETLMAANGLKNQETVQSSSSGA
jgi:hypothetical protein